MLPALKYTSASQSCSKNNACTCFTVSNVATYVKFSEKSLANHRYNPSEK